MALIPLPGRLNPKSSNARLIIYIALAIVCGFLFFELKNFSTRKNSAQPKEFQKYIKADPQKDQPDPLAALDIHERLLIDTINVDIGDSANDPIAANTLAADTTSIEYILSYLKGLSEQNLAKLTSRNQHFTFSRIMEEPGKWRGRAVHFYGILLQKDLEELPNMPKGLQKMWRLTLTDPYQAHFYTVLTPKISTKVKPLGIVSFDGIFLKRYAYRCKPDPKRAAYWQWTPVFVAKKAYYKWQPMPKPDLLSDPEEKPFVFKDSVDKLDNNITEAILDVSKSGKGFTSVGAVNVSYAEEARNVQSEKVAYEHIFKYLNSFTEEEIKKQVDPRLTFENLMVSDKPPAWAKWKTAEITCRARYVERHKVKGLESGLERVYILIAYDESADNFEYRWSIALPNLPHPLREGDRIIARGVFAKFYPYLSINNDWRWTPLIVAKEVKVIPFKPKHTPLWGYVAVTLAILAIGFSIYYATDKDDKRRERMRNNIKERRAVQDTIKAVKKKLKEEPSTTTDNNDNKNTQEGDV